jgi:phosphoribosyl-ATP pyrophosphohydrolase/phosphoribosyl-AMP cyclohydrolase
VIKVDINELKFDSSGLIPAVVQDFYTNEVLTVAYMNKESLEITLREKTTCFYSRSRQTLWRKGETSGNRQHVVSIKADCDKDALVVKVIKDGPACHLGAESCFNELLFGKDTQPFSLQSLYDLLSERRRLLRRAVIQPICSEGQERSQKSGRGVQRVIIGAMRTAGRNHF